MALDVPRWVFEEYSGAEKDFSDWLFTQLYDKWAGDDSDPVVKARMQAETRARVLERTQEISGLTERAKLYQIWKANREGWFRYLPGEYDNVREFLNSIVDEDTSLGQTGDTLFMVDTLIPTLEANGFDKEVVMGIPLNYSKARLCIPRLRSVLKTQTGQQLVDSITEILDLILDSKISWRECRERIAKMSNKKGASVWGDVYGLQGYRLIVVRDIDGTLEKFLENKCRGVIEFRQMKDPIDLLKEITDNLMGEEEDGKD